MIATAGPPARLSPPAPTPANKDGGTRFTPTPEAPPGIRISGLKALSYQVNPSSNIAGILAGRPNKRDHDGTTVYSWSAHPDDPESINCILRNGVGARFVATYSLSEILGAVNRYSAALNQGREDRRESTKAKKKENLPKRKKQKVVKS